MHYQPRKNVSNFLTPRPVRKAFPQNENFLFLLPNFTKKFFAAFGGEMKGCKSLPVNKNVRWQLNYDLTNSMQWNFVPLLKKFFFFLRLRRRKKYASIVSIKSECWLWKKFSRTVYSAEGGATNLTNTVKCQTKTPFAWRDSKYRTKRRKNIPRWGFES